MNDFSHLIEIIINNPLYLILAASLALMIVWSLIKKLYKLAIIFSICCVVYLVYIYIENPEEIKKQAKKIKNQAEKVFEQGKETLNNFKQETKNID